MYLSINWLKDFVKISKKTTPEELASLLTLHTVEVEGWQEQSQTYNNVVVGRVLSVTQHPNADRLRLTKVDIKKETLDIVCGAPNVAVGQKVAVALIGAILPNGLEIKESEIRGEKSYGMICAQDELGLGTDHEGIMVLNDNAKVGQFFADYLNLKDTTLEIDNKSLSNRGDLWGHYGMARELGALLKTPLLPYPQPDEESLKAEGKAELSVKIENKKACSRYIAVKIDNVKMAESPAWIKERLSAVGARPINAIVDITNYVMLECGQPLHAFDATGIKKIGVRYSKLDESLETLDGKERLLPEETIVITNDNEPIALAGVIGGAQSGIKENTESIIIEAATFDAVSVRKATARLNLRTEASMRFEKTLDPHLPEIAWKRAWQLIKEVFPEAKLAGATVDVVNFEMEPVAISVDFSWLKKRLGRDISRKDTVTILERLGFSVTVEGNILLVTPPTWRAVKDVSIKEDILEEVARVIGYNEIPSLPLSATLSLLPENEELKLERKVQDVLSGTGHLTETYNYSFVSESSLTKLNFDVKNYLKLVNPISEQHVYLRQSLLTNMLQNVRTNQFNYPEFGLFEIGRIFLPIAGEYVKDEKGELMPYQGKRVGIVVAGPDGNAVFNRAKGLAELVLSSLWPQARIELTVLENAPLWAEKGQAAAINCDGHEIGFTGRLSTEVTNAFGIKVKVAYVEINFKELLALYLALPAHQYEEAPKYPPVTRDLAFVVDEKILYNDFWKVLIDFHPLIVKAELFDVYQGSGLGEGMKSLAFHLTYQDRERTLTADEIDGIQADLIQRCQELFEAQVRDF
ncbi:phenylalanine--tRNA ligase subunit beta [Candidatus Falkowbacteria bacterium HGW-Falkowbacteria-2]|uniref:Phenylalanine--tRNA ligase beta subunit n=1 Tax=Candidatus Falkowbacteria bacterium HGW-Falkowbacteria-2 TaxID=2013769 RepID=A0A2N2E0U5_9BACT|nr:MAG: phenylalanine--tRNA ligase subunit beta [Candidatus Falkowbacteria bacterium HGW-Falkowbacteria-2]